VKRFALFIADVLGLIWRIFPGSLRTDLLTGLFVLDSRHGDPAKGLTQLLLVRDRLDWVINERAMAYGWGEHPKHRLTDYHSFFVQHINDGERVLDVGCGYGAVARSIARAYPRCEVTGMDQDKPRLAQARAADNPANLQFVEGDATKTVPSGPWNAVVLSNVLEHIRERVNFLRVLQTATQASRYLIRVPLFERDWQMALRRELGVDFRSDDDHKIEHTLAEFKAEISEAGLRAVELQTIWGEIWVDCRPIGDDVP
jgi:SAM-dependent methyltransferase